MAETIVEQFIPNVHEGDVLRVVYRDFPPDQHAQVLELIADSEMKHSSRIMLACLKIATGSLTELKQQLADVGGYWREIISQAEYPNYSKKEFRIIDGQIVEKEQRAIVELDKSQYLEWLNKA
jgi:hypothetical protein